MHLCKIWLRSVSIIIEFIFHCLIFPKKILDNKKCWEFYLQDFRRLNILKKDKNLNFWFLSIEQSYQVINSDWWNKNETKIDDFISFFFSIIYKSNKNINKTLIANKLSYNTPCLFLRWQSHTTFLFRSFFCFINNAFF